MPSIRVVVVGIENPAQNDASGPRHARVQLTRNLHDLTDDMTDVVMSDVRENGVPNAVAPPKVSQRRAQPCAAVRRRIDTASSRAMIVLMC